MYKLCNKHNIYFPNEDEWMPSTLEYFYKNKSNSQDGLNTWCKRCSIEKGKNRQNSNPQETSNYHKQMYYQNLTHFKTKNKIYYDENKGYFKEKTREWRQSKTGKNKCINYNKQYSYKKHTISKKEWEDCKRYFNNQCAYCGMTEKDHREFYKQQLHKEHIIDCGRDDLKNCIPSCRICNSEKHTTSLNDWYNTNNHKYDRDRYLKIYQWIRYDCHNYIKKKRIKKVV